MTPELLDELADAYCARALYASVHAGDPGLTGDNEVPGVDRVEITWSPDSGQPGRRISDPLTFQLPTNSILTHVGIWDAGTGGVFIDSRANAVSFDEGGTYIVTINYTQVDAQTLAP